MVVIYNKANTGLFDVSIAAIIDEYDVTNEDIITCEITIPGTDFNILIETHMFEETEKEDPDLELEIFSGSASGSEEDDLCESSGDADCWHPSDYEIVDENFDKISVESGIQGTFIFNFVFVQTIAVIMLVTMKRKICLQY